MKAYAQSPEVTTEFSSKATFGSLHGVYQERAFQACDCSRSLPEMNNT